MKNMTEIARTVNSRKGKGNSKFFKAFVLSTAMAMALTACGGKDNQSIVVVSREDGSGTRGAFTELLGIEIKEADGSKKDMTTKEAIVVNKTDVMLTTVAGDVNAIGYVSLGSLNDSVKALAIDGVEPSAENIKNNTYALARPFFVATKGEGTPLAQDFIGFILSAEGQSIVEESYVASADAPKPYGGKAPQGKLTIAGSSSVSPVMEKLKEAYVDVNPGAVIEIQMSDSTAGINAAIDGTVDIGMASRNLKEGELSSLTATVIAMDGIGIIVNKENPITALTSEQANKIFTGEYTDWGELNG